MPELMLINLTRAITFILEDNTTVTASVVSGDFRARHKDLTTFSIRSYQNKVGDWVSLPRYITVEFKTSIIAMQQVVR